MTAIMEGVRVADFTEYIAGPYCTMILADLGADVVKIEPPGGDRWRLNLPVNGGDGRGFLQVNRGKRSLVLDLKRPEGLAIAHEQVRRSDVVVINTRPGVAKRLGIDYETLHDLNPRLIHCQITGFGTTGPYSHRGGFDMVAQAASGIIVHEGSVTESKMGISATAIGDYSAGMFMALGILGALFNRERTGQGQKIETNLLDAAIACQYRPLLSVERYDAAAREEFLEAARHAVEAGADVEDFMRMRRDFLGRSLRNVYYRAYRTKDGFMAVACLNNALRRKLRDLLGLDDPEVDGDTYGGTSKEENERLRLTAEPAFRARTTDEWYALLDEARIPCGPLNAPEQIPDDPQVKANGSILRLHHPVLGEMRMAGNPLRFSETPVVQEPKAPPVLGSATRAILLEQGYGEEKIRLLTEQGVVGQP